MWQDLAALTPPLVMCAAFLIGVVIFLRREMCPKRGPSAPPAADRRTTSLDIPGTAVLCRTGTDWPNCRFARIYIGRVRDCARNDATAAL